MAASPPLPRDIQQLIARMVRENVTWGEERIANELSLKLGICVFAANCPKVLAETTRNGFGPPTGLVTTLDDLRPESCAWHHRVPFLVAVTARFQVLIVFVAMEISRRRILHCNVTAQPTAEWTLQQFREAIPSDHPHRFLIHDRDSIFSSELDQELNLTLGLRVLRTPVRAPQANAHRES